MRPDEAYPLSDLPPAAQRQIAWWVARSSPPPKYLDFGIAQLPSRAWWEWHWQRGVDPEKKRPTIPRNLRASVYERDGHKCLHCGATEDLTLDHIHPFSLGGQDTFENLQTLCRPCNSRKGARV